AGPGGLRHARAFASRRRPEDGPLSRVYAVEPTPSRTGAMADHRLKLPASHVAPLAAWLARACGAAVSGETSLPPGVPPRWAAALVSDLKASRGRCLVIPGQWQPPIAHALAHAAN